MKKTFLSTLFLLALCLFLPTAASALDEVEISSSFSAYSVGEDITLYADHSYKLTENVTINGTLKVTGDVTLDLNGHVLKLDSAVYGGEASGSVIEVNTAGNLTLIDSNSTAKHYFYAEEGSDLWRWDAAAEGAETQPADGNGKTYHTVTGGVITGGSRGNGGGIHVAGGSSSKKATLTMEGGSIIGCTANYGGGVYIGEEYAEFTMKSGAVIAGCAASFEGGGVAVRGSTTFTMEGGKIHDCVVPRLASNNDGRGGGVSVKETSTFTMSGGSIENCRVYTKDTTACGETTAQGGGGVYSAGTFTMTGGKIVGCSTAEGLGDGILLSESKTLAGVAAPYTLKSGDSYVNHTSRYCGNVTYAPCTHEHADSDKKCTVCGAPLFAEVQRNGVTYHLEKTADSDQNKYALSSALVAPETTLVKLLEDVTLPDASWSLASPNLTLELNGHTMTALGIEVWSNGSLTIQDSSAAKTGALDLNMIKVQSGGALKLESGKVTVSNPPADTPEVYADGKITVNGAMTVSGTAEVVSENKTITIRKGDTAPAGLTITGGAIKGSISVESGGELIMTGGEVNIGKEANLEINGGSAKISGGFVRLLWAKKGSVELSGGQFLGAGVSTAEGSGFANATDILKGGYAYYAAVTDPETQAVTKGALLAPTNMEGNSNGVVNQSGGIIVAEHTCSFTAGEGNWTCGCGRSIAGTQTPVKYLDKNGAVQYRADYKVIDSSYVETKTRENDVTAISTTNMLLLYEDGDYWYLLNEDLTIGEDCTVVIPLGCSVHFILNDGAEVKMEAGLFGYTYSELEVCAQSTGSNMGELSLGGVGLSASSRLTINGGKITVNAMSGCPLNGGTDIGDVYTNGTLTINGGSLTVERPADAYAITGDTAAYYSVFSGNSLTVNGGSLTVRVPNAAARNVYGIRTNGMLTLNSGSVTVTAPESQSSPNARNLYAKKLTVNGGTMKLKESDLGNPVTVSNGVALAALLDEGQAYWKQVGETGGFLKLTELASPLNGQNVSYSIKTCTHSTTSDVCAYCGKDLTPAPTPDPTPSTPSGSGSGSSNPTVSTETTTTPDGSTVKTETKKDGTVVETVKSPDGSTTKTETKTETKKDGTTVETKKETVTGKDGSSSTTEIKTETKPDGSSVETKTETAKSPDGTKTETKTETKTDENGVASTTEVKKTTASDGSSSTTTTVTDENGSTTTSNVSVSSTAAKDAQKSGEAVTLPVEVSAGKGDESSTTVQVDLPATGSALTVEIPVSNVTPGTVAILVKEDGTETILPLSKVTENGIQLTLEESATIKIVDNSRSFGDVEQHDFFSDAVQWASSRGITDGIGGDRFGPDLSAARAQLVTFLWRAAGCPVVNFAMDFSDVDEVSFYGEAVRWAASLGIVGGYGDGAFGTDDAITREQMAVILYRFAQNAGMDTTQGGMAVREFADYDSISDYALDAMRWAVNAGIVQGADGKLMPTDTCTRGQIVTMLYRLLGK